MYINADMVKPPSEIILVVQDDMYLIIRRASIVTICHLCGIEWAPGGTWPQISVQSNTFENGYWGWRRCTMTLRKSSSWQRPGLEYSQVVRINDVSRPNVGFSQLGRLNPIIWWWSYSPCQKSCLIKSDEIPTKVWTWQDELSLSGCNFSK